MRELKNAGMKIKIFWKKQNWKMICIYGESSTIDLIDEMTDCIFYGKNLSAEGRVSLLLRPEGL